MNCTPGDEAVGQRRLPAQLSGNNANAFLAVPAQFRRIRAISAGQSRGGRTSRDALSNAALRTEKHPNVVNVAASLDIHALRSLRARNEAMLAKSAFIHTLPDKGAMLHDINLRIDERLAILVSSPQPVQPATPSPLSPFKRTPRNPSKPSPSNLEMNGVDADAIPSQRMHSTRTFPCRSDRGKFLEQEGNCPST
ncbi:hypothetical protein BC830DRAFT_774354 [Chytriomyces sp. MP71]|nr:hypothetical protein BC830DRAFT_774354 [Chytriomyces sp. MP71]